MNREYIVDFEELPACLEWTFPLAEARPETVREFISHLWFVQRDTEFYDAIEDIDAARKLKFYAGTDLPDAIAYQTSLKQTEEEPHVDMYLFDGPGTRRFKAEFQTLLHFLQSEAAMDQLNVGFDLKVSPFSKHAMKYNSLPLGTQIPDYDTE